jgi:hypothetical protein
MEYDKTGDWKNTYNRTDALSSNEVWKKIKDPEKVVDVFNSVFLSVAKNLNLHHVGK